MSADEIAIVAPMAWMVVWALGLWFAEGTVAGVEIRQPNLWQMAGFTLAIVLSIGLATTFPERRFARETKVSAIGGLALWCGGRRQSPRTNPRH